MTEALMRVMTGKFTFLLLVLLLALHAQLTTRPMDSEQAAHIARRQLRSSPHEDSIDFTRMAITWREDVRAYVVDFAWQGAGQIRNSKEIHPSLVSKPPDLFKEFHDRDRPFKK